jgi:hypothetical protein
MISPEVKSFDSFVARMGEGKGQILTPTLNQASSTPITNLLIAQIKAETAL